MYRVLYVEVHLSHIYVLCTLSVCAVVYRRLAGGGWGDVHDFVGYENGEFSSREAGLSISYIYHCGNFCNTVIRYVTVRLLRASTVHSLDAHTNLRKYVR